MTSLIIGGVKVASIPSRNVSKTKATVQDVPHAKTFQSKRCHSTLSPEELNDQCQIVLKQERETVCQNDKNIHTIICNAAIEAIQGS